MSTETTTGRPEQGGAAPRVPSLDVSGTRPVPFLRLVGVELRKMVDTRSGAWLLAIIALATAAIVTIFFLVSDPEQRTFVNFLGATATPQGFLLPVLGILLVTSEWSQRTSMTTFTLTPQRLRIVAAKTIAALVVGLVAIVVAIGVAALAAVLGGASDPFAVVGLEETGRFALLQTIGVLQGLAFGLLFLNSAVAIVVFFVVPIVSSLLFTFVSWLAEAAPWIDLATAQQPLFGFGPDGTPGAEMTGEAWAQLGSAFAIWVLLPFAIGCWRVLRSEAK